MIKLEKNLLGDMCENCRLLDPCTVKYFIDGCIVVRVYCGNEDICKNVLSMKGGKGEEE